MARYQLQDQANRLRDLLDRLARDGIKVQGAGDGAAQAAGAGSAAGPAAPEALYEELLQVTEILARWKHDPIQREPVEKERARLEDLLRRHGEASIHALGPFFRTIPERLPQEAQPTWMQTRILTHVVDQIDGDAAIEFARSIFEDPGTNSGVRLAAAQVVAKKHEDWVVERLIRLLDEPDPTFTRANQIVLYFKQHRDPRVVPSFIRIAKDEQADRGLRRFTLEALGLYPDHRVIDALKEVTLTATQGDLRGVALNSLNEILGKEVLDFLALLRGQLTTQDPLMRLVENLEALWQGDGA